jgi:hypothetical protein
MSTKYALVAEYDAEGGPEETGKDAAGNAYGPTPEGSFVVAYCAKHHDSKLYPAWSTLAWGTPLRENKGDVEYLANRSWKSLTELWNKLKVANITLTPADTTHEIKKRYDQLYASEAVPDKWVFNDFGHMTCYYFRDVNHNGVFDPKTEKLQTQFVHTRPDDEATAARFPNQTIVLEKSHGCIHVKPADIDEMIRKGYLKRGNHIIVHTYADVPPIMPIAKGDPPYQVHFYPAGDLIQVRGRHHTARRHSN